MMKKMSEQDFFTMISRMNMEEIKPFLGLELMDRNSARNRVYLENCPYMELKDLAAVPVIRAELDGGRTASVKISTPTTMHLGVSRTEMITLAREQAEKNSPVQIRNLSRVMNEMTFGMVPADEDFPMFVATNETGKRGAEVICYPHFFEQASQKVGEDFYVLPSSIHEILLVKESSVSYMRPEDMRNMVNEVNLNVVTEKERLSDNAYHYDIASGLFETVEEYSQRLEREREWKKDPWLRETLFSDLNGPDTEKDGEIDEDEDFDM